MHKHISILLPIALACSLINSGLNKIEMGLFRGTLAFFWFLDGALRRILKWDEYLIIATFSAGWTLHFPSFHLAWRYFIFYAHILYFAALLFIQLHHNIYSPPFMTDDELSAMSRSFRISYFMQSLRFSGSRHEIGCREFSRLMLTLLAALAIFRRRFLRRATALFHFAAAVPPVPVWFVFRPQLSQIVSLTSALISPSLCRRPRHRVYTTAVISIWPAALLIRAALRNILPLSFHDFSLADTRRYLRLQHTLPYYGFRAIFRR